jgi:hypothetical protein
MGDAVMVKMRNGVMTGALDDIDGACEHIAGMLQTKAAILQYVEHMAQVLAEAGRASAKAMGDPEEYAVNQWSEVIRQRAIEILRAEKSDRLAAKRQQFRQLMDKK